MPDSGGTNRSSTESPRSGTIVNEPDRWMGPARRPPRSRGIRAREESMTGETFRARSAVRRAWCGGTCGRRAAEGEIILVGELARDEHDGRRDAGARQRLEDRG